MENDNSYTYTRRYEGLRDRVVHANGGHPLLKPEPGRRIPYIGSLKI